MNKNSMRNRFCVLSMALLVAGSNFAVSVQAQSVSVYQKLGEYEKVLFGQTENSQPIEKRLQKIEKQLFGKPTKSSNTGERVNAIEKVMSGAGAVYLPPIAPEMDRSEFAPAPQKAPDNPRVGANAVDDQQDAPLPADMSDRVKGLLRQAMQCYSQGKTVEAERLYQQVLAIDFRNVDANYNLAAIAENKGDLSAAKRYYSIALKGSPGDADISDALSAIEKKLKAQESATRSPADDSAAAVPVTAADRAIAEDAAAAYKKGNFDESIQKLGYLARKNPYDANTQFALGQAYRGKGNSTEALRHLRSAATLDPKNDLYVKALNDAQTQVEDQQTASTPGSQEAAAPTTASASGRNDVTPFVGLPGDSSASSSSGSSASGLAAIDDYLRRNTGNVMFGSVSSYGAQAGMGYGSSVGGFPVMLGSSPGSTRLRRIMTSSLSGAAIGALSNRGYPGGMSKGAMRGAMYGGLFGLMMGGF